MFIIWIVFLFFQKEKAFTSDSRLTQFILHTPPPTHTYNKQENDYLLSDATPIREKLSLSVLALTPPIQLLSLSFPFLVLEHFCNYHTPLRMGQFALPFLFRPSAIYHTPSERVKLQV